MSWLLFQASRIFMYQQCPFAGRSTIATMKCDCEQQSPAAIPGSGQPTADKSFFRQRPEEPFTGLMSAFTGYSADPVTPVPGPATYPVPAGYCWAIFQPPRA